MLEINNNTILEKFLEQKTTMMSSEGVGNLLGRNKTPKTIMQQTRLLDNGRISNMTLDNIQGITQDIETRRKKSLLYREGKQSIASLDGSYKLSRQRTAYQRIVSRKQSNPLLP